jgi:hypothetical protein
VSGNDEYVLVRPGAPEQSFLIKVLRGKAGIRGRHTPTSNAPLSDIEIDLVERWVVSLAGPVGEKPVPRGDDTTR